MGTKRDSDTEAETVENEWLCKYTQMFRALLLIWYGYRCERENRSVAQANLYIT